MKKGLGRIFSFVAISTIAGLIGWMARGSTETRHIREVESYLKHAEPKAARVVYGWMFESTLLKDSVKARFSERLNRLDQGAPLTQPYGNRDSYEHLIWDMLFTTQKEAEYAAAGRMRVPYDPKSKECQRVLDELLPPYTQEVWRMATLVNEVNGSIDMLILARVLDKPYGKERLEKDKERFQNARPKLDELLAKLE